MGYRPWGHKGSDMTECAWHAGLPTPPHGGKKIKKLSSLAQEVLLLMIPTFSSSSLDCCVQTGMTALKSS